MVAMYYRPAHTGAGQVYHLLQLAAQRKALKAVAGAVCNKQGGLWCAPVKTNAMGIIKVHIAIAAAAKMVFQLARAIVLQYVLRAIAISNKYVAIFINTGFG